MTPAQLEAVAAQFCQRIADKTETIERGRERMKTLKVAVTGLARDVAKTLPCLLRQIDELLALFLDAKVLVIESDSVDGTKDILRTKDYEGSPYSLGLFTTGQARFESKRYLPRAAFMAQCRNAYWEMISSTTPKFDHVIVLDLDAIAFSINGVCRTFGEDNWDAVASLGLAAQPDWYNPTGVANFDVWAWREVGQDRPCKPGDPAVRNREFHLGSPMIPLSSAFGGMAVYTMEAFASGPYRGGDCEHVQFHADQRAAGRNRFFVNPDQIVAVR